MRQLLSCVSAALLSLLLLSGCAGSPKPAPVIANNKLPAEMFTCETAPNVATVVDDRTLAVYLIDLWAAWYDCSFQLAAVGRVQ